MKTNDLLIEIGCEDLPYWTGPYMKERWLPVFTSMLKEERVAFGAVSFFYSLRRLIIYVKNLGEKQYDLESEIYGPPLEIGIEDSGAWTAAAERFVKSYKATLNDLVIKERKGKKVLVVLRREKGLPVSSLLGDILNESIKRVEIPRGMRWNDGDFRFIRPVRWILALFGERVIRFELGKVKSGRLSYGHRVVAPEAFTVSSPIDYMNEILKRFVIFDQDTRFELIKELITEKRPAGPLSVDEESLRRISALVEYPVIEICHLKEEHVSLPAEVVSAVITNLNGITLLEKNGKLHQSYVIVCEGKGGKEIKENYMNVLNAKMEDAIFFMEKDLQTDFASYTENLKSIIYHPKWGSLYDRVERFKKIYSVLTDLIALSPTEKKNLKKILTLSKNDLPTLMVAEFPSLEGIMGRLYAEKNGYNVAVSSGIEQHYWPRHAGDKLPERREAAVASLIVRIESICGLMIEETKVGGDGDPYGLKKLANGMIEIIWEKKLNIPLEQVIARTLKIFNCNSLEKGNKILNFIYQRVENILAGQGVSPGIRRAVIAVDKKNLVILREKIDAFEKFFNSGKGAKSILLPFIRVANILRQAEEKALFIGIFDETLLVENAEIKLYNFYLQELALAKLLEERKYSLFLRHLSGWKEIIDSYFDDVLIMSPDEKLRANRLALLKKINELFNLFADFSLIPIVEVETPGG